MRKRRVPGGGGLVVKHATDIATGTAATDAYEFESALMKIADACKMNACKMTSSTNYLATSKSFVKK